MIVVFVGILVGATCGFASAAVAHYARGVAARGVSGIVSANVVVIAYVALLAEGDLSVLLVDDVLKLVAATCLVATGAGLMAAINVGREVGS
jgi:hypothetical protein